jgi:MFS family permease
MINNNVNQDPWHKGLTPMHWRVLVSSFLGWVFDGYEALALVVVLAPMLHSLLTPEQMATPAIYAGLTIGITLLGWGIGGIAGGVLADYVGRKKMMLWSVFFYALFSGFTAFSTSIAQLCVLRFITGLAMGSEWSTGISLLAETWPERARAKGAGFLQSGFGWGTLFAALIWYVVSSYLPMGSESWRVMFIVGALPAFFVLYIRRGIDESAKWKAAVQEKHWGATSSAIDKHKSDKRPFTLAQVFATSEARRLIFVATALSIVTTVGWWAISSWLPGYTVAIAKAEGLADAPAWGSRITIYYTIGAIIAYVLSGFVIDSIGRKWFLFLTYVGAIITTYITYAIVSDVRTMAAVAPINGFFTLGCAYVWMAIYPAELFTSTVRSTAVSFIFNAARMIAWVFPIIAGTMIQYFGGISHAALTLGSVYILGLFLPWFLPETKGKGLPY